MKQFIAVWLDKILSCLRDNRGELTIKNTTTKTTIGNTTYAVSSFFNTGVKVTVLDKITRLIERDTAATSAK